MEEVNREYIRSPLSDDTRQEVERLGAETARMRESAEEANAVAKRIRMDFEEHQGQLNSQRRKTWAWRALFGGALLIALGQGVYTFRLSNRLAELEHNMRSTLGSQGQTIQKIGHRLSESVARNGNLDREVALTRERLDAAHGELQKTRLTALSLVRRQKESTEKLGNLSSDVVGVKQEVGDAKEQLASTRSDLQGAIGDLGVQSDLVARNRAELEELKLLGQRDYYEFALRKSKRPERVANIAIALRKTDVKRQKYTLTLVADDRVIEKKEKTVNEPVQLYQEGYRQPTEIVVNQIYKDRIAGYVSVPKKKEGRSSSAASGSGSAKTGS